jgi:protein-tyrosine phosphatase
MSRSSVLFVCLGNICRSPTGEGVLQHLVEEEGLEDRIFVDSAGTIGYHEGNPADPRMSSAALKRGIELRSRSRKITPTDLETFDLVLAMDQSNLDDIRALHDSPSSKIALLSDYLDDEWPTDVPDPYYGGESGFEFVMDMIEAACPNVLEELL